MDKLTVKAAIMSAISEEIDLWLDKSEEITDGHEYEEKLINTTQRVGKIVLSNSLGDVSADRNKKNFRPVLGRLK